MRLAVRPFGVLGSRLMADGAVKKVAAGPAPGLPIVDPAGLHHIRNGPGGAGGAAGQIYRWLGISEDVEFPAPVREAIQAPLQAKMHFYGLKACLHVAGPNFGNRTACSREAAIAELTEAYSAMLREFGRSRMGGLRMLPISGGIFAGPFAPELPVLTRIALRGAFDALPRDLQHAVSVARLDMCIFMEDDYDAYVEAFEDETRQAEQFVESLDMGSTPKLSIYDRNHK